MLKRKLRGLISRNSLHIVKLVIRTKKFLELKIFFLDPENPSFPATKASLDEGKGDIILRDMDTEYKILNDIDKKLGDNREAKGTITMLTEKDTCGSCNLVISNYK
ncbi:deaminase domain-containing protein [Paenibacillus polymyxa]|uniref:deaminase domain-containing protein n=1 Tax=Paenibacillus polymyxa TaxID=1406 RepID=UPI000845FA47|nr:deaminase domain-containing protein [Paenibacillus polymyxa]AOK91128.1 hypothetical protein AOU00_15655 [Paenibacillus polymyxa]